MNEIKKASQEIMKYIVILVVMFIGFRQYDLELKVKRMLPRKITVTAYSPTERQTDSSPFITAYNEGVRKWMIACSNDLRQDGWLKGDRVYLYTKRNGRDHSFGMFDIEDGMHPKQKEHCDILVFKEEYARKIGINRGVWAILVKKRDMI